MRRLVFGVILIGGLALSSAWGDLHMDLTGTVVSDSTPGAQDGECIQVGAIATDACYGAGDFGQITSYTADPSYPQVGSDLDRYGWALKGTIVSISGYTITYSGEWWILAPAYGFSSTDTQYLERGTFEMTAVYLPDWSTATVTGRAYPEPGTRKPGVWPRPVDWYRDGSYGQLTGTFDSDGDTLELTLESVPIVELRPEGGETCYKPGEALVVEVYLRDAPQPIGGGEFRLSYDTTRLGVLRVDAGDEPFDHAVSPPVVNPENGEIDCAVAHEAGTVVGARTGVMARLYFQVRSDLSLDDCGVSRLVAFREVGVEEIPTRLYPFGGWTPICPELVDLPALAIDSTPPTISPPTGMPASADAGRCDALLVSLTDFESEPGEPPAYDFAMQLDGFVERTDPEALSGDYSIRITLSEPSDYARVRVVDPGIEGLTLGNCSGMFAAMVVPGSLPGQGPYMMFEVDANKNGEFDGYGVGLDALVIAAGTGIGTRPQGHWYTDGLNGGDQVHVVGDRTGLNPGEFVSGGTGLLSALRARTFDGETTWGDLPILGVRVGAGEWPNSTWFECYVDDIIVAKALELPPAATDNCRTPLVTYTGLLTDPYENGDTITWTATDACGNSATCEQTVTVEDRELPTIACPVDITVPTAPGACAAEVSLTLLPDDDWVLENDAEFVATDDGVALMLRNDGPSP